MMDYTNWDRREALRRALTALRSYSTTPLYILGDMPEGVDADIWQTAQKLEAMIEDRIKTVGELDLDAEAPVMLGA